jgi:regulator of protease activity HflC (stomatin/prohibitin superfamily)
VISIPLLIIILLLGVIFFMLSSGVSTLEEYQRAVRFRFGKFDGVVGPGLVWSVPYVDTHIIVDMRTQTFDIKPQEVITKDNIKIKVDAIVYGRVIDPKKAIIEVKDYKQAIISLLYAEIREAIGKLELEELIGKTEELNDKLFETLNSVSKNWGVETQRVEVESIELPAGLTEAMTKRKEALEYKAKL